ncbi:TorF family putative porin [Roseomonas sp. BN140053]|uniref:TorF family putative porin n=1 Tax=Roseomonas sp. BN140053 TaxID=3391898 RepID=UPI0039EA5859
MNKLLQRSLAAIACALGIAVAQPAAAQIEIPGGLTLTLTPSVSSDYLFRGVSQTRNRGAVQATVDLQHETGFYIGAFVSNVAFQATDARQEVDILGGYRFKVDALSVDLGAVGYVYPGYSAPAGGFELSYFEVAAKLSYEFERVKLLGSAFYSPNFQLESRNAVYVEGGVEVKLPLDLTLAGRAGYQWIDRNERYGLPNFANWNVTLSRDFFGFLVTVGYFDTNVSKRECGGGQKICDARAMVIVSHTF